MNTVFLAKWMELEDIIFCKMGQIQEDKYHTLFAIYGSVFDLKV
jgi:hypothetical protein